MIKNFTKIFALILTLVFSASYYTQTLTFSSTNPAVAAATVPLGSLKVPIYSAKIVASGSNGSGANLSSVSFTPTGTFTSSDITKYQFWYNTTNDLATAINTGPDITTIPNPGTQVTLSPYNPFLGDGQTWYIWITADIKTSAGAGRTLTVGALSPSNFTFSSGSKTGTMSAGGTQTFGSGATDSDGDGIPDSTDLDDDNDGILDTVECGFACGNPFENGGFEFPVVSGFRNVNQNTPGIGWQTTATDGLIELWRSGFYGVTAAEGSQFVELNATQASTLYQTFCLNGMGGTINWTVKHRARQGTDVAAVKFGATIAAAQASTAVQTMSDGTAAWGTYSGTFTIPPGNTSYVIAFQAISTGSGSATIGNFIDDVQIVLSQPCLDTDGDGIIDSLDVDSDNDGCADAIEGSENVKYNQIHDLNLPLADPNYAYRGQIKVTYNGTTTSTPSGIISNSPSANGVPQLLNNAGNNQNASTNPSNLAGAVDNTDGTADIGQGIGDSQDNTINSCKCYKPAQTSGTILDTNHGITALGRAGADNSNWPMVRKGAWTALEAKTKGFVINRLTDAQISAISSADLVEGMMVYNISQDCLQINIDGTAAGWKCFNTQTCPDY